jgi:hypothetical protein
VVYTSAYTTPALRALTQSNDYLEARLRARALLATEELRQAAGTSQPEQRTERDNVITMPSPAPSYTGS